ncbi:MAG TPA: hypothetical protein VKG80_17475, partial [Trebonia sp.]|nr:hypothetical protein [Trebonia sp.]
DHLCLAVTARKLLPSLLELASFLTPLKKAVLERLAKTPTRHIHGDAAVPAIPVLRPPSLFDTLLKALLLLIIRFQAFRTEGKHLGQ